MKSERGVTITSVVIYVIALTITVLIIGRITTYFYKNLNSIDSDTKAHSEFMKFNSFFTEEVNIEGNSVKEVSENNSNSSYIIFEKTGNQYTWKNNKIYKGKICICKNIENCVFLYDKDLKKITVVMNINKKPYNYSYTVIN